MSLFSFSKIFSNPVEFCRGVAFTALAWLVLYEANTFLFSSLELNEYVNFIFLPAAARMLAVLLAGSAGAFGLFVGAMITNAQLVGTDTSHALILSTISAIGPFVAVWLTLRYLKISKDLSGIKWWHLFYLAAVGALCNVIPTQLHLWSLDRAYPISSLAGAMLIGDLLGTLIVLWFASIVSKLTSRILTTT